MTVKDLKEMPKDQRLRLVHAGNGYYSDTERRDDGKDILIDGMDTPADSRREGDINRLKTEIADLESKIKTKREELADVVAGRWPKTWVWGWTNEINFKVNGKPFFARGGNEITYVMILRMAGYDPERVISVVYQHPRGADVEKGCGTIIKGQTLRVLEGTVITAMDTSNA